MKHFDFQVRRNRDPYQASRLDITFTVDEFDDLLKMIKDNNEKLLSFLEKFKIYNPEIGERNANHEYNGIVSL